jgi:hypothetical protein
MPSSKIWLTAKRGAQKAGARKWRSGFGAKRLKAGDCANVRMGGRTGKSPGLRARHAAYLSGEFAACDFKDY